MFSFRSVILRLLRQFNDLRHFAGDKWRVAITLADGFRIAWVSTLSVAAAMALLVFMPQGKDLFLDVRGSHLVGILFWFGFYAGVLFIWLLPVYISSCWILKCYPAGGTTGDRALASWVRDTVPRVLVVTGLVAVLAGQVGAVAEAPYIATGIDGRDQKQLILFVLAFISGVFLLVVCRKWLFERFSTFDDMRAWRINVRGMLATLAMFVAVMLVGTKLKGFGDSPGAIIRLVTDKYVTFEIDGIVILKALMALLAVPLGYALSFVPFRPVKWVSVALLFLSSVLLVLPLTVLLAWVVAEDLRSRVSALAEFEMAAPLGIGHLVILPPITLFLAHIAWMYLKPARDVPLQTLAAGTSRKPVWALQAIREKLDWHFASLLLISIAIICVHISLSPVLVTEHIYRALLLPFLLGLLIPVLTFVSFWSFRWHAPFVLAAIVVLALIAPDLDDIRTVKNEAGRPTLEESVKRWQSVNDCETPATDPARKCPSPIIIAAAGGASRSAFLVGSVIGKLLDEKTLPSGEALRPFDQQLFAISGVSGGALGAVVTYAALADNERTKGASRGLGGPPCKNEAHDSEWFAPSTRSTAHPASPETSWRDCLQLILSGDFLSPVTANLISGELVGYTPYGDRAAVLETAWEQRYAHLTGQIRSRDDSTPTTMASSLTGLRERGLATSPKAWLPMLLLTGTSVSTGRRILTSDVDTLLSAKLNNLRGRLFRDAYDLHELISPPLKIWKATFSPDGRSILILYTGDTKLHVWDVDSHTKRLEKDSGGNIRDIKWSPDSKFIMASNWERNANVWRVSNGELVKTFEDINENLGGPAFTSDGRSILIGYSKDIALFDLEAGQELRRINIENLASPRLYQNGRVMSVQSGESFVFSEVATGRTIFQLEATEISETKDGSAVYTCKGDRSAAFYNVNTGELLTTAADLEYCGFMSTIAISSDQQRLLINDQSSADRTAAAYNLATGTRLFKTATKNRVAVFTADGRRLLYASEGKPLLIRDIISGSEKEVRGTASDIWNTVRLGPGGQFGISWADIYEKNRGGVNVIDISEARELPEIRGQEGKVDGADFHPDGKRIFTWSDNGLGRLWNLENGEELFVTGQVLNAAGCLTCDIRLSTAATMSARFPIISPHGTLRKDKVLVDRVVDGGYFENFGALTASELAEELHSQFGLEPRIILINNEPSAAGMSCLDQDSQIGAPKPERRINFSTFRSPIDAMWATRTARGTHAAVDLCARTKGQGNFAFVTVKKNLDASAELPMSWWLSKHAQQYLDAQIDSKASDSNDKAFSNIEAWRKIPASP